MIWLWFALLSLVIGVFAGLISTAEHGDWKISLAISGVIAGLFWLVELVVFLVGKILVITEGGPL